MRERERDWGEGAGRDGLISLKEKVDGAPERGGRVQARTWTEERGINGDTGRERETD